MTLTLTLTLTLTTDPEQASLQQLRDLMARQLPRLAAHLDASGIDVTLFATQWYHDARPNPNP